MRTRWLWAALAALFAAKLVCADDLLDARKVFLQAQTAAAEGRYRDALDLYRKVIADLPNDAVVRYEYAQVLRDLPVTDEAIKQAQEAVRLDPGFPEAHHLLGALLLADAGKDPAKLDQAITQLQQAHKLMPEDVVTTAALARAFLERGRAREAAAVLDQLPETQEQPALMKLAAEADAKSGQTRKAEELYRDLLEDNPGDRDIIASLVDLYEDEDRIDEALGLLTALEKKDPDNPAVAERIAIDLARAGRFDEAEKRARGLAAKRPENRDVRRLLAQVLFEKGDAAASEKILRDLAAADPDDDATRRALVDILVRDRRFPEASALLVAAPQKPPADGGAKTADPWATVELGFIAYLQKNYPEARKLLEPVGLTSAGGSARATRILLGIARDTEDAASGLAKAKAAAQADSSNAEWEAAIDEFELRSGDKARAQAALAKMASSDDLDRVLAAADVYARVKDYAGSALVARQAVDRFPDNTDALFRLASSLERNGKTEESEKSFEKLLNLRPNDAATLNYLGYMWADRGVHLEQARGMLEKAVAREPQNGAYRDSLGWVYFRLGRLEAAEKNLRDAHRTDPDDPTIEEHLGDLASKMGNAREATQHWERALTLKPDEPDKIRQKLQNSKVQSSGKS